MFNRIISFLLSLLSSEAEAEAEAEAEHEHEHDQKQASEYDRQLADLFNDERGND